jgi:ABC-2 type transport system ATP-binding protein
MLTLTDIRKTFGSVVAVERLSLRIAPGEVYGLLGPNGAGKTTTISIATGLLAPDSGTVNVGGKDGGDPREATVRRLVGIAPQAVALYDQLTADENLRFFGSIYGLSGALLATRIDECLRLVGLTDRRKDRVHGYSGGMKRRLNLAAALLHEPRIVFMDEPTAGVDPQSRAAIFDIVLALKKRGVTIVYSTHYMEEAERMCDRIGIIDHGRLMAEGTLAELLAAHGGTSVVEFTREGQGAVERVETMEPVTVLVAAANAGGLSNARIQGPDLEGVFLKLTGRTLRD